MPSGTHPTEEEEFCLRREFFFGLGREDRENFYLIYTLIYKIDISLGLT